MIMQFIKLVSAVVVLLAIATKPIIAGEDLNEEGIKLEISYLAKRLLDITGEDSYTITSDAVVKPFIGICSNLLDSGVQLTCVTPDSQAAKAGLETGDVITKINGLSVAGQKSKKKDSKGNYWSIVKSMEPGDELKMEIEREGKTRSLDVMVGSLSHPSYSCKIDK